MGSCHNRFSSSQSLCQDSRQACFTRFFTNILFLLLSVHQVCPHFRVLLVMPLFFIGSGGGVTLKLIITKTLFVCSGICYFFAHCSINILSLFLTYKLTFLEKVMIFSCLNRSYVKFHALFLKSWYSIVCFPSCQIFVWYVSLKRMLFFLLNVMSRSLMRFILNPQLQCTSHCLLIPIYENSYKFSLKHFFYFVCVFMYWCQP